LLVLQVDARRLRVSHERRSRLALSASSLVVVAVESAPLGVGGAVVTLQTVDLADCRPWLREHGYDLVASAIDRQLTLWRLRGVRTRRNWWDVLAGGRGGAPRVVAGLRYPVLAAAQRRQGKPVTPNAIERPRGEQAPAKRLPAARWAR